MSGEAQQITAQRKALSQLPTKLPELTVYTSDGYQPAVPELAAQKEFASPAVTEIAMPETGAPSIEFDGYAIEL